MYVPSSFGETDPGKCLDLLAQYPFATVITPAAGELWVSHLPLLARVRGGEIFLAGHLARANAHWQALSGGAPTTAIFHGPQGYISPTWYAASPAVPTWNYVVVHARGQATVRDDAGFVAGIVRELTERFEGRQAGAWSPDGLPADFAAAQLGAIVGFEIAVGRLEAKLKLSQNRSAQDRAGVMAQLEAQGSDEARTLAAMMRARA
jgi:transcriptional regulator